MKTQQEYIEQGEQYILKTYNRFPVVLEKGEGVYLYDADQKKYLDFGAGIAVFALGYGNEAYNQALKDQIDKLIHTSNLYYNIPAVEAAKKIVDASGLKKVFFTNSGTEAIEGALKVARKYACVKIAFVLLNLRIARYISSRWSGVRRSSGEASFPTGI